MRGSRAAALGVVICAGARGARERLWAGAVGKCPHRRRRRPVPARSASTPETWARFTQENLDRAERERLASVNLRVLIDSILRDTAEDLRLQCDAVNLAFGRRCEELEDACHKLENHLHKVTPQPRAQATPTCAGPAPHTPPPRTPPPPHSNPARARAQATTRPRHRPTRSRPQTRPRPRAPPRPAPELTTCNYRATKLLVGSAASGLVTTWPHPGPSSVLSILRDPRLKAPTPPRALTKPIKNQVTLGVAVRHE